MECGQRQNLVPEYFQVKLFIKTASFPGTAFDSTKCYGLKCVINKLTISTNHPRIENFNGFSDKAVGFFHLGFIQPAPMYSTRGGPELMGY